MPQSQLPDGPLIGNQIFACLELALGGDYFLVVYRFQLLLPHSQESRKLYSIYPKTLKTELP